MESATADTALSVPTSPPPRDSMEDADPSLTRKRPRLDSGGVETPDMHTDTDTDADSTTAPPEQQVEMTIRSQPPSLSHIRDAAGSTDDTHATATSDHPLHVPATMDGASSGTNDVDGADDSSADSPPVIAIDDDDDDDAGPMGGYATAASFHVEYDADTHLSMFPFAHNGDYMYAAQEIAKYIQSSESFCQLGAVMHANTHTQIRPWMELSSTNSLTG